MENKFNKDDNIELLQYAKNKVICLHYLEIKNATKLKRNLFYFYHIC